MFQETHGLTAGASKGKAGHSLTSFKRHDSMCLMERNLSSASLKLQNVRRTCASPSKGLFGHEDFFKETHGFRSKQNHQI